MEKINTRIDTLNKSENLALLCLSDVPVPQSENALTLFMKEVYEFSLKIIDPHLLYFTLQYTKTFLLVQQQKKSEVKEDTTFLSEAVRFIDASIHWSVSLKNIIHEKQAKTPIVWTGKIIHFVEWIYGADSLKNFNNGEITMKELMEYIGNALNIKVKDPSGCYVDMRDRVNESRTVYIDSMREALLARMKEDDEKKYQRNK